MVELHVDEALLPSDDDVAAYQEHGWYISKPIFTDDDIDAVTEATDRFYNGEQDLTARPQGMGDYKASHSFPDPGIRKSDYASFFIAELAHIVRKPILAAIAARLAQTPSIRLWHDQLLWKDPQTPGLKANVGWHTDRGYWQTCSSENMLTAWVPFHDCDEAIGTITMIDGSHRWSSDNDHALNFFNSDLDALEKAMVTDGHEITKVPMHLKKGQVSFHHCRLIHGSGPNTTQRPRRSVAVHLQDAANSYRKFINPKTGKLAGHYNQKFCRSDQDGNADFSDPDICPTLFPREE